MTAPLESSLELELCPFMKQCDPDDEQIENYCAINYENCENYIKYMRKRNESK